MNQHVSNKSSMLNEPGREAAGRVERYRHEARHMQHRLERQEVALGVSKLAVERLDRWVGNPTSMLLGAGVPVAMFGFLRGAAALATCGLSVLAVGLMAASVWGISRAVLLKRCTLRQLECAQLRHKVQDFDGLLLATSSGAHRLR